MRSSLNSSDVNQTLIFVEGKISKEELLQSQENRLSNAYCSLKSVKNLKASIAELLNIIRSLKELSKSDFDKKSYEEEIDNINETLAIHYYDLSNYYSELCKHQLAYKSMKRAFEISRSEKLSENIKGLLPQLQKRAYYELSSPICLGIEMSSLKATKMLKSLKNTKDVSIHMTLGEVSAPFLTSSYASPSILHLLSSVASTGNHVKLESSTLIGIKDMHIGIQHISSSKFRKPLTINPPFQSAPCFKKLTSQSDLKRTNASITM